MNKQVLQKFIKIAAAGAIFFVYAHSYVHVTGYFGFNLLTIGYLYSLFMFYSFLYIVRFWMLDAQTLTGPEQFNKPLTRIQVGILILNLVWTVVENIGNVEHITYTCVIKCILCNLFTAFPDYIFNLLLKLLRNL